MAVTTSTSTTTTQATTSSREPPSTAAQIFNAVYEIGVGTGAGALAGYLFAIIDPVGGAIFGASYAVTRAIGGAVIDRCLTDQAQRVTAYGVCFIASLAAGSLATTMLGFAPLTVLGALGMVLAMSVTSIAVRFITQLAGGCANGVGSAHLALQGRFC